MKRFLSLLLVLMVCMTVFSASSIAAADNAHSHYDDCTGIPEFYSSNDTSAVEYWNSIKAYLPSGTQPILNKNGSYYPLNFRLWHDKHFVVYGSYRSCNNTTKDWKPKTQPGGASAPVINGQGYYYNAPAGSYGEYRYHGFTAAGDKFTNAEFPVDAYLGKEELKKWIVYPWASEKVTPPIKQSPYSYSAIEKNNITTQKWINRSIPFSIYDQTNQAYKYMHIQQAPTTNYPGQGRMWHLRGNSLWYQSFPIPKMDQTTKIPIKTSDINVSLEVNNPDSDFSFIDHVSKTDNEIIKVSVTVTAELLDAAFYNDPVEKVNHYTRDDIDSWVLTLNGESQTVHKWSVNTGKADFTIPLTKAQIKGLQNRRYSLTAKGQACFLDKSKSVEKSAGGYVQFIVNDEPVPPPPPEPTTPPDPEIPPITFEPSPLIPEYAFDIVEFGASDSTDMSTVESREVFVDGVQVNDDTFFAGSHVFGENSQGLKQVVVNYTSTDGQKAQVIKWVLVYTTKPRAQYVLDGSYKQNRKLTLTNTSLSANDKKVIDTYPIISYQWEYTSVTGSQSSFRLRGSSNDFSKEFLYKEPGTYSITLRAVNSLGRVSDPYIVQFVIAPDVLPAIEICLDNSVLARNETISAYHYLVSSTDGDVIKSNSIELWYDSNNDGSYDQLVNTFDGKNNFPAYTPTKLGRYKYINWVDEDYGQETLLEFITPSDRVSTVQEVEFLVDNYIPMTDIYIDIPVVKASDITATAKQDGKTVGIFIEFSLVKTVTPSGGSSTLTTLTQLQDLIEVLIPLDTELQGKDGYIVYRYHGNAVDTISTKSNDGEKIELIDGGKTIKLTIKKFSTYAVGYTAPSVPPPGGDSGGNSGGNSGSNSGSGSHSNSTKDDSNTGLPYYIKTGNKIFLGYSSPISGTMKYIAPIGEVILFKENQKNFIDVGGHWAKESIDFVTERELFIGTAPNVFSPDASMTRAMFATVIGKLHERSFGEISQSDENPFTDISPDSYYTKYVIWAEKNGIVKGIGGGKFDPERAITRQEMATLVNNYLTFAKFDISATQQAIIFDDESKIADWAKQATQTVQKLGIIKGMGQNLFNPQGVSTRAQVAAVIQKLISEVISKNSTN